MAIDIRSTAVIQPGAVDYSDFYKEVDRRRKEGLTDTDILGVLSKNSQKFAQKIQIAQGKYGDNQFYGGEDINNDRDLVNFLSSGYSGRLPSVASVPVKEEPRVLRRVGESQAETLASQQPVQQQERPGFVEEFQQRIGSIPEAIGDTLRERGAEIGDTFNEFRAGDISGPEAGLRTVGDLIGTVMGVLGKGLVGTIKLIPGTEEAGSAFLQSDLGQKGMEAVAGGVGSYMDWKAEHPRASENLEALVDIADVIPAKYLGSLAFKTSVKTAKEVVDVAGGVGSVAKAIPTPSPIASTSRFGKVKDAVGGATQTTKEFVSPLFSKKGSLDDFAEAPFKAASPEGLLTSAIKPKNSNFRFKDDLPVVMRELADDIPKIVAGAEEGAGYRMLSAIKQRMSSVWDEIDAKLLEATGRGAMINQADEIAEEILKGLDNVKLRRESPEKLQKIMEFADKYRGAIPAKEAQEILSATNAKLQSFYRSANTSRNKVFKSDPMLAMHIRLAEKLREQLDNAIGDKGLKRRWSALINVQGELEKRLIVASRQNITSLAEQLSIGQAVTGGVGKLATGNVPGAAAKLGQIGVVRRLKVMDSTDGKIFRAFNRSLKQGNAPVARFGKTTGQSKITKVADFERATGLSKADAAIEKKAFERILKDEDKILDEYFKKHGKVINTDEFRPFFKGDGYAGHNAASVQEPASYLAKRAYTRSLENDGKFMTASSGGSGTGKSSALKGIPEFGEATKNSSTVLDSNLSSYSSALKKIKEAQDAGKKFVVYYTYREPLDSFENGVVKRMVNNVEEGGRLVPSDVTAGNHIDSWEVAKRLSDEGIEVRFVDNSLGFKKAKLVSRADIEKKINYPSIKELTAKFNAKAKELLDDGTITPEQYQGYIKSTF